MCSCHRDGKAKHTDACRASKRRWNHSAKGYQSHIREKLTRFERQTGVKP